MEHWLKKNQIIVLILLVLYIACILYITLLSRERSLTRIIYTDLFWSYREWLAGIIGRGSSIAQNILLFIPFGYSTAAMISPVNKKSKTVIITTIIGLIFSLIIEFTQYYTGCGSLDVDDIFNNTLGTILGAVFCLWICKRKTLRIAVPVLLIIAGFFGCLRMTEMVANPLDYTRQFWFSVDRISADSFTGTCCTYDRSTPEYQIFLKNGNKVFSTNTTIDGDVYTASAVDPTISELEILVDFKGVGKVTTNTYISNGKIRYVSPYPETEPKDELLTGAVLKAYSEGYDTYVYESYGQLIWLIGYDIDSTTEIIYHIHTSEPERLPENRVQYAFDNRGFHISSGSTDINEEILEDHYKAFIRPIPKGYNVTSITVGFNPGEGVVWRSSFRP